MPVRRALDNDLGGRLPAVTASAAASALPRAVAVYEHLLTSLSNVTV